MKSTFAAMAVSSLVLGAMSGCAGPGKEPTSAHGPQVAMVKGEVAYTDLLRYDYTGDGKRNRIRFWMAFDAHAAIGTPGAPGYKPAAGTMRYFLRDEDDGTKVMKWRRGLDMEGAPKDAPIPMSAIAFDGRTVKFEAFGIRWTITDGGQGHDKDLITSNDGFRSRTVKLYGGDVWVGINQ